MFQLLFLVLLAEGAVAFLLLVKIGPLRELIMRSLDQLNTGKGLATIKTLACTMSIILASNLTSIVKFQNRTAKLATFTPMDQVLWRTHLLEASLIGYSLFLGFIIYRMHHYLRKLIDLKIVNAAAREEIGSLGEVNSKMKHKEEEACREINNLNAEIAGLRENLKNLEVESEKRERRAVDAEKNVATLQKQAADLLLEYDHLLEDNQNLQTQIASRAV